MAATFHWNEDNGAATGSPAHGTTRSGFGSDTHYATDVNWKNADDCTANGGTPYSSAPIYFGNNSYSKYQYGKFTGSFATVSTGLFAHTSGSFGAGLTLKGTVSSTYATPATSANAALTTNMTTPISLGSGLTVLFSTTGPEAAGASSSISAPGYSQYLATQLQTTTSAAPGDTTTVSMQLSYFEN